MKKMKKLTNTDKKNLKGLFTDRQVGIIELRLANKQLTRSEIQDYSSVIKPRLKSIHYTRDVVLEILLAK